MPTLDQLDVHALRQVIATFRDTVRNHSSELNRLNVYPVPDGDTGTNMSRTLDAVVTEMEGVDADDLDATCDAISHGSLMGARGNSGVILSQILRGVASTLKDHAGGAGRKVADALSAASTGAYQAVMKPIEGTILTVVRESAEAAKVASASDESSLVEVLRAARDAGREALANTPELLPVLKDAGVVDAGGAGYLLFLDSALHVVDGEELPEPDDDGPALELVENVAMRHSDVEGELDVSEQRYEVMYFLDLVDDRIGDFRQRWAEIGDSIVVVGGDGLWNCHIHTNEIGDAIEAAIELDGRPRKIRVTDLFEEVAEEHTHRVEEMMGEHVPARAGAGLPPVTTAVVAVCSGDGLAELFANLKVQGVVGGGQTSNPSTAELLETVDKVNADQVVILPNNKNIIPVAEQVNDLTTKSVVVVPTRTMPEALAALITYDPEASAEDNAEVMIDSISSVSTGEVTQAVRDSSSSVGPVAEGQWIGLVRGDGIVSVADTLLEASMTLIENLVGDDGELLTVITGTDATTAMIAELEAAIADRYPDLGVDVHRGGQPLYPYLFGVE